MASYLEKLSSGVLRERVRSARAILAECTLCPRECRVNRLAGSLGHCRAGARVRVARHGPHFGEEPPLTGVAGAGTIFFSHCSLRCLHCQNYQISHEGFGRELDAADLASVMLELQAAGCHNLDLVSPTHFVPQILEALLLAAERGLAIPLVYNTNGYDSLRTLALLDGVVDIYLPDAKFGYEEDAQEVSQAPGYVKHNEAALVEMYRQVADLQMDAQGLAVRGLIVRHLLLPDDLSGTYSVLCFLAERLSTAVAVSLMAQYYPAYQATAHPRLNRRITQKEYEAALVWLARAGFTRYWVQELESSDHYRPDFSKEEPFVETTSRNVRWRAKRAISRVL